MSTEMAGAAGFEPTHARIKTWCLTAWRRPCICVTECSELYIRSRTEWQGRLDSNQRMPGSKPGALPLGDAPTYNPVLLYNSQHAFTSRPIFLACGATSRCYDPGQRNLAKWLEVGGRLYQHRPGLGSSQTHKLQCRSIELEQICSTRSKRYELLGNASEPPAGSHYDHPPQEGCEL